MKIPNKRELQQTAANHSSGNDFKDFMKLYKDYTKEYFIKYARIQVFTGPYSPVFSHILCSETIFIFSE